MNPAAHLADVHDPPTCPGCGRPMRPVRHAVYTCDHDDTPTDLGLPRGDDTAQPRHEAKPMTSPWPTHPDRGPLVLRPGIGEGIKRGET